MDDSPPDAGADVRAAAPNETSGGCLLGSRAADRTAVALLLALMAATAPFLRVYHRIVAVDLTVVEIAPDGTRTTLPQRRHVSAGLPRNGHRATVLRWLQRTAREQGRVRAEAGVRPGTRLQLTARWSENSLRLDRQATVTHDLPAAPPDARSRESR